MLDLSGKRVTVMGLGRFGGGIGVTKYLCSLGADVLVTDTDPADKLSDSVAAIQPLIDSGQASLRLGEHNVSDFTTCDLVVANAAVPKPWDNRFLRAAEAAKIPVTTEISLSIDALRSRGVTKTIGITGSVGKSTTTAMIHDALTRALPGSRVVLGGNIGGSLLSDLNTFNADTILVLELSSAMLYWLERTLTPKWSPAVAVITNISPNHIDWHGDFDHYSGSKRHLIEHQSASNTAILGESVLAWQSSTKARVQPIDASTVTGDLKLPGAHNRTNAVAALAACRAIAPSVPTDTFLTALRAFGGLIHRLQFVAEHTFPGESKPRRYFNDSKSTTPDSTLRAVEAIASAPGNSTRQIHLIAGGYDKGSDLSPIARLSGELAMLYTIGKTGPAISAAATNSRYCETLKNAVREAHARMQPGDILLLSPGCASWGQYVNFEQRGDEFIALVHELIKLNSTKEGSPR